MKQSLITVRRGSMKYLAYIVLTIASFMGNISVAFAQWSGTGGVEYFKWKESTVPSVTETGPRFAAGLNWNQRKDAGWLAAYRGKLYTGRVDYSGALLLTGAPVSGRTDYNGITNEIQAIYRAAGSTVDFVGGLGWDYWQRNLSASQKEDFNIVFLRLGADLNTRTKVGFYGGAGVKYPVYTRENAHLTDIGFDQNPDLKPGKDVSLYAQLGYRLNNRWDLIGYYDSYRFSQSDSVRVTAIRFFPGTNFSLIQPRSSMDAFGVKLQYTF